MKKNLIKMRVCLGYDCKPRLDVISYEDEVTDDGKAYQSTRGVRNERTLVEIGKIWMRFDNESKEPYWDAYMIVDAQTSEQERAEKAMQLYETAINAMSNGLDELNARFRNLVVPALTIVENEIKDKLTVGFGSNGKYVVSVEDFKKLISNNVKTSGAGFAKDNGYDIAKWDEFFTKTLTPEILAVLMKGLPVLKFVGNGIEFQTNEMYKQALDAVSMKVTSDVFARFVEAMNSQAK